MTERKSYSHLLKRIVDRKTAEKNKFLRFAQKTGVTGPGVNSNQMCERVQTNVHLPEYTRDHRRETEKLRSENL